MGHGWPDYRKFTAEEVIYPLKDVGEAAVRLGSINSFDRRGAVLFLDDFEQGLGKWYLVPLGTGAEIKLITDYVKSGAYAAKILTSATNDQSSAMYHYMSARVLTKIGFELSFSSPTDDFWIDFGCGIYDGSYRASPRIRYVTADDQFYYRDENFVLQPISPTYAMYHRTYYFHTVKFVFDFKEGKYVRLLADNLSWDLSAYKFQKTADTSPPFMSCSILAATQSAKQIEIRVDDVIITLNEP